MVHSDGGGTGGGCDYRSRCLHYIVVTVNIEKKTSKTVFESIDEFDFLKFRKTFPFDTFNVVSEINSSFLYLRSKRVTEQVMEKCYP
jgi:hypothetical protein